MADDGTPAWRRRLGAWLDDHPRLDTVRQTFREFVEDEAPLHAAALAFFTLFAVAPLLVLVLLAGQLLWGGNGDESARGQLFHGTETLLGQENADALQEIIANAQPPGGSLFAVGAGVVVLLYAASRVFLYIEKSLNRIWDVEPKGSFRRRARKRFLSFAMVLGVGFLLLASLVVTSLLSGLMDRLAGVLPWEPLTLAILRVVVTLAVLGVLFTLMYKVLPDARIEWHDAAVGGGVTALLFAVGQWVIGRVVGQSTVATAYGSLASIVVVLLWFYYTALVFLLGAEFTQVYARRHGEPLRPEEDIARRRGERKTGTGRKSGG